VTIFADDDPLALIRHLHPDVLAKGGEWHPKTIVGADDVRSWGGRVVRLRQVPGVRTSKIVAKIRRS
jgi:D-beta-D-heptose 7-phosphate kinase/D-beta-D-heptose 1-phosphate adenosyltransferase